MEGTLNLFIKDETHGFTVLRHINWDSRNWVAITPVGSVVIFRDRTDSILYAAYSSYRGHYHVHIPLDDIISLDERANEVLKEVLNCLRYAECYIDRTTGMVYSANPILLRRFIPFGLGPYLSIYKK